MMDDPTYDLGYWDLPKFHCELVKPISDDAQAALIKDGTLDTLKYGKEPFIAPGFRESLTDLLKSEYNDNNISSSTLLPTYGATFGAQFLFNTFFSKGDPFICQEITYGRVYQFAKLFEYDIHAVPSDGNDVSLTDLEEAMKKYGKKSECTKERPWRGICFLLPILNNPLGTSFSEECSIKVVELARKYSYLVITDDVYHWFQFVLPKRKRMLYYDKIDRAESGFGNVISNGTLSKILFPSMRVGWIEGSPALINYLSIGDLYQGGGGFNSFNQGLANKLLRHPRFGMYLEELKQAYKNILNETCEFLEKNLSANVTFRKPDGSCFLWVKLPEQYRAEDLLKITEKNGTIFLAGQIFSVVPGTYENYFRLSVTNGTPESRKEGLKRICEAVKSFVSS